MNELSDPFADWTRRRRIGGEWYLYEKYGWLRFTYFDKAGAPKWEASENWRNRAWRKSFVEARELEEQMARLDLKSSKGGRL